MVGQRFLTVVSKMKSKKTISGLTFINHLRPVSYTVDITALNKFLGVRESLEDAQEAKKAASRQVGFIAQEVEEIVKESGFVFSGIDAPQNENSHYGIRYSEFVVPLVKAVQELSARSEEQQKKIEQLLSQLDDHSLNEIAQHGAILFQNSPNPFTTETAINVVLPDNIRQATVIIYNLEGKQLKAIVVPGRGSIAVKISASDLPPGMYLYTLIADGEISDTKRMILTK